jgi:hypothetical protein
MTFCCKNFQADSNCCKKLGGECVPGRKGCVLDGAFKLSPALAERVDAINTEDPRSSDSPADPT